MMLTMISIVDVSIPFATELVVVVVVVAADTVVAEISGLLPSS